MIYYLWYIIYDTGIIGYPFLFLFLSLSVLFLVGNITCCYHMYTWNAGLEMFDARCIVWLVRFLSFSFFSTVPNIFFHSANFSICHSLFNKKVETPLLFIYIIWEGLEIEVELGGTRLGGAPREEQQWHLQWPQMLVPRHRQNFQALSMEINNAIKVQRT